MLGKTARRNKEIGWKMEFSQFILAVSYFSPAEKKRTSNNTLFGQSRTTWKVVEIS